MTDERQGLPSASKFEMVALCPGQPALEASLRSAGCIIDPPPDEYQQRGLRIHAAREFMDELLLADDSEIEIFRRGIETEEREKKRWVDEFEVPLITEHCEQRLWLQWPDGSNATSARLDVCYAAEERCLVIELKSLWCRSLTPAERNYQGAVQAVLCKVHHGAKHVRVVFNKAMFGKSDVVDYDEAALERAERMIFDRLWQAQQTGAPTQAGSHCHYCPCKPHCRSAAAYSLLPSVVSNAVAPTPKAEVQAMVAGLTPSDWAYIKKRASTIRNILDAVDAQLEALPPDALAELGFRINDGRKLDPIGRVQDAFEALSKHLPEAELWQAMEMGKGSLVKAAMRGKGLNESQAKKWVAEQIQPFVTPKRSKGSLEEL